MARELGLPASYVDELDLPYPVAGAVRFDDQAEFHPVKYVDGIAAALRGPGPRGHARHRHRLRPREDGARARA